MKIESTYTRALEIQRLVAEHYQPERQDRCKSWVYRNKIKDKYKICERTFWRYLAVKPKKDEEQNADDRQLSLF